MGNIPDNRIVSFLRLGRVMNSVLPTAHVGDGIQADDNRTESSNGPLWRVGKRRPWQVRTSSIAEPPTAFSVPSAPSSSREDTSPSPTRITSCTCVQLSLTFVSTATACGISTFFWRFIACLYLCWRIIFVTLARDLEHHVHALFSNVF